MPTAGEGKKAPPHGAGKAQRPTIGLLLSRLDEQYQNTVWPGVADVAEEQDVNLLCFAGEVLRSPYGYEAHGNVIYDLVTADTVDGLILMAGSLGNVVGLEEMTRFCQRYRPLPMVSIALPLEGIPSVLVDNYKGMRDAVSHLLDVHGYRRVAFVRGPAGHGEADERYRAYIDVLAEHGLPLDLDLIVQGSFRQESGGEAVQVLLDQRKVEFEALVAANDRMAIGVLEALQSRGIRVPYDIAVVGFDDVVDARIVTPPLTTVRQPLYGQGRRAAEMLLAQLRGEDCPLQESLRMELVTRQSCACFPEEMAGVVVGKVGKTGQELQEILDGNREKGLAEMGRAAALSLEGRKEEPDPTWAECLLNAFAADLGGKVSGTFLPTLDDILRMVVAVGGDLGAWQGVLSALRRMFGAHVTGQSLVKAEDLVQQGRVLIGEMAQRVEAQRRLSGELLAATLRNVGLAMSTTISPVELTDVLVQQLPQLGIERFYLSLYEGDDRATARLILACQGTERVELGPGDRLFPTRQLIPPELWPQERRYTMALTPLFLRDRSIGLAVFEMGPRQGIIYGALQGQLSTALQGALLFRERESLLVHLESRALQLQTAAEVAQAASSILDLPVLLQRVVDLVVERFGLYYAGLMLVDADGRFATLRAGTGEAGRQMVAQGLRLEAGSHSMVGWCLTNKQPRIAADVTADPSYLKVPLLPETRSEMVVPLLIGDRVIGVLDIQSRRIGAFAEDEVLVFQTMADQLAVAIENARVVAEMRGLNEDLQRTLAMQARLVETIEALSTPVVPLINGIILLPLVGNIDSGRSQQIIDHLLAGVQAHRAKVAIVDITGVPVVDTSVANSLIRAARAVGLLGANVVLVGIRPEVAQTMVTLGVDLASMVTHSNLQNGIAYALWQLGFRIAPR